MIKPSLKVFALALAASALLQSNAAATLVTYQPNPSDLNDLDHHMVYTWRINNVNLNGGSIQSASITFANIANWDTNPNVLHLWLLDTARNGGVASFVDDPTGGGPVLDMTDDFLNPRFHSDPNWLVAAGTSKTFLDNESFTLTPRTYTYTFNSTQVAMLQQYLANGNNLAFGLDPDCHFFNDGVTFSMNYSPVPEMSTLLPLVGLFAAVSSTHFLRRQKMKRLRTISSGGGADA